MNHLFSFGLSATSMNAVVSDEAVKVVLDVSVQILSILLPVAIAIFTIYFGIGWLRKILWDYASFDSDKDG